MLSYKKWKTLNESFDTSLGLATPQAVGIMSNAGATLEELIAERKKMKKKMLGERPDMDMDDDEDETGDGEMVEPTSLKDKIKDDDGDDDGDDHGDEHGDDDEDHDDHDEDDHGDEHDEDDMKGDNPLLSKIQMMKKKMKNKMKKKCSSGKMMKKKMAKEETESQPVEDNSFIQSISKMMSGGDGQRNWDGISPKNEDALLPIIDPNTGFAIGNYGDPAPQKAGEPQAGEVGFAPQGKIGDFFGN